MAFQQVLLAQGKIAGNVVNNAKAVEFATVTISNVQDSNKVLVYEATDSLGKFSFNKIDYGKYLVKIKIVGFLPISKNASINATNKEFQLNDLNLIEEASELNYNWFDCFQFF